MEDDDDDIYGSGAPAPHNNGQPNNPPKAEESDEVEEDEEDSDSDIDIITERKPTTTKSEQTTQTSQVKNEHVTSTSVDQKPSRSAAIPIKPDPSSKPSAPQKPGYEYPEVHTSSVKIDDEPTYEPVGKPITEVDFDADLAEHDKPWRRPGADQSDYFNYGFDEFTWAMYCLKQKSMRDTITDQKAESAKFEAMLGGGMPGMPGMGSGPPTGPSGAQPNPQQNPGQQQQNQQASMPTGMSGMPDPDMMNQMMQQMMAQGIDPSQMDFNTFMSHMQGQGGGGGGQNFGGQPQGQAYGDVGAGGGGGGGGGGRGRGRRGGRW